MANNNDILVLGCGLVTPFGAGSGVEILLKTVDSDRDEASPYWSVPDDLTAEQGGFPAEVKRDRACSIAASALTLACRDAGIQLSDFAPERVALVLGCAFAGQLGMIDFANEVREQSARFVSPIHFPQTVGNYPAGVLSRAFKIHGPNLTISTGAHAGLEAVATACAILRDGSADIAIAGGVEVLSEGLAKGLGPAEPNVWAEGGCFYLLGSSGGNYPRAAQAIIRRCLSGQDAADPAKRDTYDVADRVGRSLAAESAMRLAAAIAAHRDHPGEAVVSSGDQNDCCALVVEVQANSR